MWCGMAPRRPWSPACSRARPEPKHTLEDNGIDAEGSEIILRREIQGNGKGRVYVNNQPATVNVLRSWLRNWPWCMRRARPWAALTRPSSAACSTAVPASRTEAVAAAFEAWREIRAGWKSMEGDEQARLREADLWSFQKNEIESGAPAEGKTRSWRSSAGCWRTRRSSSPRP